MLLLLLANLKLLKGPAVKTFQYHKLHLWWCWVFWVFSPTNSCILCIMATSSCAQKWLSKFGFKVGYLNVCHLLNKISDIHTILSNANNCFHAFGFSETRLIDTVSDHMISVPGYNTIRRDAQAKLETGLVLYVHQSVNYKQINNFDKYGIECIWLQIHLKGTKPMLIGFLYRNPDERIEWFDRFELMMDDVLNHSTDIMLLGDFNIDLLKPHKKWKSLFESYNLSQLINTPTRKTLYSETLIDHIYVTNSYNIIETSVPMFGLSDHFPICLTWSKKGAKIPRCGHKCICFRNYKSFDTQNFLSDLCKANFSDIYQHTDPDEALASWYHTFLSIFNKHAPSKIKRVKFEAKPPWLTDEIHAAIAARDNLLRSNGKDEQFKKQRNKVTAMKRAARKKYFSELISSKKNTKLIWKAINQLSGKPPVSVTPSTGNLSADSINKHFISVAQKTVPVDHTKCNDLLALKDFCESKNIQSKCKFEFISVHEVYKELCLLKQTNSRGLDDLDSKILKISAPIISEHITYIYNLCIEKCHFPKAFKDAKVLPLFKSGDPNDPSNYRPISILSTLSKPLEKHLKGNLQSHFLTHDLFHPNQSGFRKNHSCHTLLTNLIEQWHENINNDLLSGTVFVDFAKAFDTIDHELLLRKLVMYGLCPESIKLVSSFLSDRRQAVLQGSVTSSLMPIKYGVPQGSVLGPILFLVYINDLPLNISISCELFADDTTLHNKGKNASLVCDNLQKDIDKVTKWSELNHMALHPHKSKFMLITTRQKRQNIKSKLPDLKVYDKVLAEVDSHNVLGLSIDNSLSWSAHVSSLSKKISKKVFQLNRIKHLLDEHTRKLFFHAYIQPDMDYASTCWDLASKNCLKRLESLYRRSLKVILLKSSSLLIEDYKKLNILPLNLRCRFNKGVLMYKIMNSLAPPYLYEKFSVKNIRDKSIVVIPRPRTDLFMSSLVYSGSKIWNDIPDYLKKKSSLSLFKTAYQKYLFQML